VPAQDRRHERALGRHRADRHEALGDRRHDLPAAAAAKFRRRILPAQPGEVGLGRRWPRRGVCPLGWPAGRKDDAGSWAVRGGQFEPRNIIRPRMLRQWLRDDLAHPQPAAPAAAVPTQPVRTPGVIGRRQLGKGPARMPRARLLAQGGFVDLKLQASRGYPKPVAAQAGRCHGKPQRADSYSARDPGEGMPPLSAHVPVGAGWPRPGLRLRAAGPAESKRTAGRSSQPRHPRR
jgi:hypothetical protein